MTLEGGAFRNNTNNLKHTLVVVLSSVFILTLSNHGRLLFATNLHRRASSAVILS